MQPLASRLVLPLLLAAPSVALQGADDCGSAQVISGEGVFSFDNSLATLDGPLEAACLFAGTAQVDRDVWFEWTAPATGAVRFATCGGTAVDTRLAVQPAGTCGSAAALGCNDDQCGLQSELLLAVTAGQSYLIRLGTYPGSPGGAGGLIIERQDPVTDPNTGHAYLVVPKQTDWFTAKAGAEAIVWNGQSGHLATVTSAAERDFIIGNLLFDRVWIGLEQDTSSSIYTEPAGAWGWVTGELFSFTSWNVGEPNDSPAGENHGEMFADGTWNDAEFFSGVVSAYLVEFEPGAALFCSPASSNSTGAPVTLGSSTPGGAGVFHLEASGGPAGQFGYFLVSAGALNPGVPVGQGSLCLAGPVGRYSATAGPGLDSIGAFDAAGVLQNLGGTSSTGSGFDVPAVLPTPPGGVITPGSTWHFQLWYRDQGGTTNFSDAVLATF